MKNTQHGKDAACKETLGHSASPKQAAESFALAEEDTQSSNNIFKSKVFTGLVFIFKCTLLLLIFGDFYISQVDKLTYDQAPRSDRRQYVTLAYHMVHHGVYSDSRADVPTARPSWKRPVAYPLFISAVMLVKPHLQKLNLAEFTSAEKQILLRPIKKAQILLFFLAILASSVIAFRLSNSWICFFATLALGAYFPTPMLRMANEFLSENLALPLVSFSSLAFLLATQTQRKSLYFLSGLLLGALALTRAVYFYFWIFPPLLVLATMLAKRATAKSTLLAICALVLGFWLVVSPYMFRNLEQFGSFQISGGRGGRILFGRIMVFNQMKWSELIAGFVAYGPSSIRKKYLDRHFSEQDYYRFDKNHPDGFRQKSRRLGQSISKIQPKEEKRQKRAAFSAMLKNPVKHLAVTTLLGFRGAMQTKSFLFDLVSIIGLYALCILAIFRKNFALLAAFIVPLYGHTFYASLSHFIVRYGRPHIAINIAAGVLFTYFLLKFFGHKCTQLIRSLSGSSGA